MWRHGLIAFSNDRVSRNVCSTGCPKTMTNDLYENGSKSWPEVAKILNIEI